MVALVRSEKLLAGLADGLLASGQINLLPPGAEKSEAFVWLPAGPRLPGWHLALSLKDEGLLATTTEHRAAIYFWTGILVVVAMGILTLLAVRLLRRQAALARLKNDLVATVSHELKTPLSSMRVLLDTLLDCEKSGDPKTREYLQLVAQENELLSRLIENFLTFSRMERRKYTFHFKSLPARQIVNAAVEAVRERFAVADCHFEVQVEPDLPEILADPEAMPTALINLLDNAWKYSEDANAIIQYGPLLDKDAVSGSPSFGEQHKVSDLALEADVTDQAVHVLRVNARRIRGIGIAVGIAVFAVEEINEVVSVVHVLMEFSADSFVSNYLLASVLASASLRSAERRR